MKWFVSKEIDSEDELLCRQSFYSKLSGKEVIIESDSSNWYVLCDGRRDNLCMIVGHTDTVYNVLTYLRNKSQKKYKVYICSCAMSLEELKHISSRIDKTSILFLSKQELINVKEYSKHYGASILACEFVCKDYTGLGFRATRSELGLWNSQLKGFHNKLETNFERV